jgi:hypothetical protein
MINMPELDFEKAERHLKVVEESITQAAKMPGVNIAFYAGAFFSLKSRFDKGERTESLFNEIMELD